MDTVIVVQLLLPEPGGNTPVLSGVFKSWDSFDKVYHDVEWGDYGRPVEGTFKSGPRYYIYDTFEVE